MSIRQLSPNQVDDFISEMNAIASSYNAAIQFTPDDWAGFIQDSRWVYNDHAGNPLKNYLRSLTPDRKSNTGNSLFRFMSSGRLSQILSTDKIQISNMLSNFENDAEEYKHYFGLISPSYSTAQIEKYRERTFILCMTKSHTNGRMWKEYTEDKGVCVEFEIQVNPYKDNWIWDFREVHYGNANNFTFLINIINTFKSKHGIDIVFPSHKFAQFYKREHYSWEGEVRISIQEEDMIGFRDSFDELFRIIPIEEENGKHGKRRYLNPGLSNCLFTLNIKKVYLGKSFSSLCNMGLLKIP
jgi:hypothetical protein